MCIIAPASCPTARDSSAVYPALLITRFDNVGRLRLIPYFFPGGHGGVGRSGAMPTSREVHHHHMGHHAHSMPSAHHMTSGGHSAMSSHVHHAAASTHQAAAHAAVAMFNPAAAAVQAAVAGGKFSRRDFKNE